MPLDRRAVGPTRRYRLAINPSASVMSSAVIDMLNTLTEAEYQSSTRSGTNRP